MSIPLYAGIGAGIGAIFGGAAGYMMNKKPASTVKKIQSKELQPNEAKPNESKPNQEKKNQVSAKKETEDLFGVQVTYLLSSSEFYSMLVRFETYLQFATERDSLKAAVEDIDNFLGMEALLHGRDPISKAALPALAELARRKVLDVLSNIVAFSHEQRPSSTKKEAMNGIKDEINQNMLAIVKDMNRALAALPAIVTTKTK